MSTSTEARMFGFLAVGALFLDIWLLFMAEAVQAQTPEACRAQLRHLTVPEFNGKEFAAAAKDGSVVRDVWSKLPSRLLFAANGIEGYADTYPTSEASFLSQVYAYGMSVLVVYQEEQARQAMIKRLRDGHVLQPWGAPVNNLKYSRIVFMKPLGTPWRIVRMEYDQPTECINVSQEDVRPVSPRLPHSYVGPAQVIVDTGIMEDGPEVDNGSEWHNVLQAMLAWVKESSSRIDRENTKGAPTN